MKPNKEETLALLIEWHAEYKKTKEDSLGFVMGSPEYEKIWMAFEKKEDALTKRLEAGFSSTEAPDDSYLTTWRNHIGVLLGRDFHEESKYMQYIELLCDFIMALKK